MARTTIDIDRSVLDEAKELGRKRGQTLGETVSVLLAEALKKQAEQERKAFNWYSQPMGMKVNIDDKDSVSAILDEEYLRDNRP